MESRGASLVGQQDAVAKQRRLVAKSLFGSEPGQLGSVIGLREVAENNPRGAAVVVLLEKLGGGVVGEMANAGEHALLDRPGIRAVAEHLEVVVGFQQQNVDALEGSLDVGRHVAQVGSQRHADALGLEDEAAGIGGIVGNGEGRDVDVADGELGAGVEVLDRGKVGGVGLLRGSASAASGAQSSSSSGSIGSSSVALGSSERLSAASAAMLAMMLDSSASCPARSLLGALAATAAARASFSRCT